MAIQDFVTGQVLTSTQMDNLQANDYNQTVSAKVASYVLLAADKGTRVTMSNAGATTITVNTSLFAAGDTLFITNIGAGACTITAGTATVSTASSLVLAQYDSGRLYFTSTGVAIWEKYQGASAGGGKVLQVVMGTTSTAVSNSTNVLADTGLTATITPSASTSKVLVLVNQNGLKMTTGSYASWPLIRLYRGATSLTILSTAEYIGETYQMLKMATFSTAYLDSPATTSATVYKTQFQNPANAASVTVQGNSDNTSTIILLEIGA